MASSSISKNVFSFLQQLEKNNNREWFQENKKQFIEAQTQIKSLALCISNLLDQHDSIENTKVFRIYRDVRFSWSGGLATTEKDTVDDKTYFKVAVYQGKEVEGRTKIALEKSSTKVTTLFLALFYVPNYNLYVQKCT